MAPRLYERQCNAVIPNFTGSLTEPHGYAHQSMREKKNTWKIPRIEFRGAKLAVSAIAVCRPRYAIGVW